LSVKVQQEMDQTDIWETCCWGPVDFRYTRRRKSLRDSKGVMV